MSAYHVQFRRGNRWGDLPRGETPPTGCELFHVLRGGQLLGEYRTAAEAFAHLDQLTAAAQRGTVCKHCNQARTAADLAAGQAVMADRGVKDPAEFPACENCAWQRERYYCPCGSGQWADDQYDAQGIYLAKTCDACQAQKMRGYRPEILTGYTQADVDEPIESD